MTDLPARAPRPGRVDLPVTDLGREPVGTPQEATVRDDAATHAGAEGHEQPVLVPAQRAVARLAPGRDVRVVVDDDREIEIGLHERPERCVDEHRQVRCVVDDPVGVDHPRRADSDGDRRRAAHRGDPVADRGDQRVELVRCTDAVLVEDRPRVIDDADAEVRAAEVDPDRRPGCARGHAGAATRAVTRRGRGDGPRRLRRRVRRRRPALAGRS